MDANLATHRNPSRMHESGASASKVRKKSIRELGLVLGPLARNPVIARLHLLGTLGTLGMAPCSFVLQRPHSRHEMWGLGDAHGNRSSRPQCPQPSFPNWGPPLPLKTKVSPAGPNVPIGNGLLVEASFRILQNCRTDAIHSRAARHFRQPARLHCPMRLLPYQVAALLQCVPHPTVIVACADFRLERFLQYQVFGFVVVWISPAETGSIPDHL